MDGVREAEEEGAACLRQVCEEGVIVLGGDV